MLFFFSVGHILQSSVFVIFSCMAKAALQSSMIWNDMDNYKLVIFG